MTDQELREACYCGLSPETLNLVAERWPGLRLVIRYRDGKRAGANAITARAMLRATAGAEDVRDVMLAAGESFPEPPLFPTELDERREVITNLCMGADHDDFSGSSFHDVAYAVAAVFDHPDATDTVSDIRDAIGWAAIRAAACIFRKGGNIPLAAHLERWCDQNPNRFYR